MNSQQIKSATPGRCLRSTEADSDSAGGKMLSGVNWTGGTWSSDVIATSLLVEVLMLFGASVYFKEFYKITCHAAWNL